MTNFEMVETLRQHANVSYEEAKQALEETNWDILEAMVLLEKQGKVTGNGGGTYTTRQEPQPEKTGRFKSVMARLADTLIRLIRKGNENFLEFHKNGKKQFELNVTVVILLLIFCFWVMAPLLVIGLFTGFRYVFRGPDLGKENINGAMDKASEFAENIKKDVDDENQ